MVEPIDAQNMLSRTPMVEKTVAGQKEQAALHHAQNEQFKKERLNEGEHVTSQGETEKTEDRPKKHGAADQESSKDRRSEEIQNKVEWVDEAADEPDHEIDVTI